MESKKGRTVEYQPITYHICNRGFNFQIIVFFDTPARLAQLYTKDLQVHWEKHITLLFIYLSHISLNNVHTISSDSIEKKLASFLNTYGHGNFIIILLNSVHRYSTTQNNTIW